MQYSIHNTRQTSENIVSHLLNKKYIEVTDKTEAAKDVDSVFVAYKNTEQHVSNLAQETIAKNDISRDYFYKTKLSIARQNGIEIGENAVAYLIKQIIAVMMQSPYVDEVYAEDHVLQKNIRPFIREIFAKNKTIDKKIKKQLRHVDENTEKWKIEYQRLKEKIDSRKS